MQYNSAFEYAVQIQLCCVVQHASTHTVDAEHVTLSSPYAVLADARGKARFLRMID